MFQDFVEKNSGFQQNAFKKGEKKDAFTVWMIACQCEVIHTTQQSPDSIAIFSRCSRDKVNHFLESYAKLITIL